MLQLIFASNNPHKVEEIQSAVGNIISIISLKDASIEIDIPEPYETLEENASEKSKTIYRITTKNCFGEDTGLEVEALHGEPGVKSARYAGDEKDFEKNLEKLLEKLSLFTNKAARFRTVISLIYEGNEYLFEGICHGHITDQKRGVKGFGYDAIFMPSGSKCTFAEMTMEEKNVYSHRKKAVESLVLFLQEQIGSSRTS